MKRPAPPATPVEDDLPLRVPLGRAAMAYVGAAAAAALLAALLLARFTSGRDLHPPEESPARAGPTVGLLEQALFAAPASEGGSRGLTLLHDQQASLAHYGWVDRESGVVRVPIDRAFDLLLESSVPAPNAAPVASGVHLP